MAAKIYKARKLRDGAHYELGKFDNASRWYPHDTACVPGSFEVRGPSRAYPYSYLKHCYTVKFARLLAQHNPHLYVEIQGIKGTDEAKLVFAQAMADRI